VTEGIDKSACALAKEISSTISAHNKGASDSQAEAIEKQVAKVVIEAKDANKKGKDPHKSDDFKSAVSTLKKSLGPFLESKSDSKKW